MRRPDPRFLARSTATRWGAAALALVVAFGSAPRAAAQSNLIPGTDVALGLLDDISAIGRQGSFPNGVSGAAMSTTSCNFGSVEVPWFAAMDEDHPFIAFIVTREDADGRLRQISDRSAVKHGFFALQNNQCGLGCQPGAGFGDYLGVGCSDTYGISTNGDKFHLGPADEVDPWLGEWDAFCSYFDLGLNPGTCDASRSFTQSQAQSLGPVGTRINLRDQDLIDTSGNATFAYQAQYVVRGEPEAVRGNNLGWKEMTAQWTGNSWDLDEKTSAFTHGSILDSWNGADVHSATNGSDDGRVYVAAKVSGPRAGKWHYEYALHNRDNARGIAEVRIPFCASAPPSDFGFSDIDGDALNDWTAAIVGNELVFTAPAGNGLAWNTIYNLWFDCAAAPETTQVDLVQDLPGAGAGAFSVAALTPTRAILSDLGPGCAASGNPPRLVVAGANSLPELGNPTFGIGVLDQTGSAFGYLFYSPLSAATPLPPSCTAYLGGTFGIEVQILSTGTASPGGATFHPLPIPNNPIYEGAELTLQALSINVGGPFAGLADLSNGARLRVGSSTSGCF